MLVAQHYKEVFAFDFVKSEALFFDLFFVSTVIHYEGTYTSSAPGSSESHGGVLVGVLLLKRRNLEKSFHRSASSHFSNMFST